MALQIELGIASPTGYFGDATAAAYNKHKIKYGDTDSGKNLVRILQHALFCKGYNPTAVSGYFGDETLKAVKKVQTDAGFSASSLSNEVSAKVFKQILSSDALVLVAGGDSMIRKIQQTLNREYSNLFDLIPCDGKYNAATNKALIYAFQIEGGMDKDASQDEGLNNYTEVAIKIVIRDQMTTDEVQEYYNYKEYLIKQKGKAYADEFFDALGGLTTSNAQIIVRDLLIIGLCFILFTLIKKGLSFLLVL
ncbi:MAG: peptidoglycan-binding protein [Lachnospiraceae bacterium]|nr:peptidoglycan-binding protein [Lachnospiraceae bacterium]